PARERWFLAAEGTLRLPRGAAILDRGALAGTVLGTGSGYAIGAPFGEFGEWAVVWLPHDPERAPVELVVRAAGRAEGVVLLALDAAARVEPGEGVRMTGPNGLDCPAGLPIGEIVGYEGLGRTVRVRLFADGARMEQAVVLARPRKEP